jgi:hypothetical protein
LYSADGPIDPGDFPDDLVNVNPLFAAPAADDYHIQADSPAIDAGMNVGVTTDLEGTHRPQGSGYDIGAYEFTPALELWGVPANQTILLGWSVNQTLPITATWTISYTGPPGNQPSPITGLSESTRAYTLTGVTNYSPYKFTLNAMLSGTPILTDTVTVMPSDTLIYLPEVYK